MSSMNASLLWAERSSRPWRISCVSSLISSMGFFVCVVLRRRGVVWHEPHSSSPPRAQSSRSSASSDSAVVTDEQRSRAGKTASMLTAFSLARRSATFWKSGKLCSSGLAARKMAVSRPFRKPTELATRKRATPIPRSVLAFHKVLAILRASSSIWRRSSSSRSATSSSSSATRPSSTLLLFLWPPSPLALGGKGSDCCSPYRASCSCASCARAA
mmetsp:Transcript_17784/g.56859  ORF Transcript_17784/g.56859 Transcript_17784/m.56859 type:complete len:215 (+) Transcript_17784:1257-1901(+)